jgi:FKBP-type peptidyl-prolyl cis-trans isomerase FkpA
MIDRWGRRVMATLSLAASSLVLLLAAGVAAAADPALATERDRVSYLVAADIARDISNVAPDLDYTAFERAMRNAFDGGKPLLSEDEARDVGTALMRRIGARTGKATGLPPGTQPPAVAKDKVGLLVGTDIGRSLYPIRDQIDIPVFMRSLRHLMGGGKPQMTDAELDALRTAFSQKMQAREEAKRKERAQKALTDGQAFLARNRTVPGVFTTSSGLQYQVLRQGSGKRPRFTERVRVNYEGRLLDGTVFDSSYQRGQSAEFSLGQVIAGWTEGLTLMPVGAKYRFWIPAALGYGEAGSPPNIGPNEVLVFEVELQDVL